MVAQIWNSPVNQQTTRSLQRRRNALKSAITTDQARNGGLSVVVPEANPRWGQGTSPPETEAFAALLSQLKQIPG